MPTFNPSGVVNINPDGTLPSSPTEKEEVLPSTVIEQQTDDKQEIAEVETTEKGEEDIFSSFLDSKNNIVKEEPEVKKEVEVKKEEVPIKKQEEIKKARDYSDLDPDAVPLFKNMSNEAFNKLKPLYLEHKKLKDEVAQKEKEVIELKSRPPQTSVYEHEESYLLDPVFRNEMAGLNAARTIYDHWSTQLNNVRSGAKEIEVLQLDPNSNSYKVVGKVAADVNSETELLKYLTYSQNLLMQQEQKVRSVTSSHKTRYTEGLNGIKQMEQAYFNAFDRPENQNVYKPLIDEQLQSFPPTFRTHPVAVLAAKSLVMNAALAKMLQKAASDRKPVNVKREVAGPSAAEAASEGGNKSNTPEVTIDEFNRVKEGY